MAHLARVNSPPKGLYWKIEVDGRNIEDEASLLQYVRELITSNAFYYKTNFKDKGHRHASFRQKNFTDGYWVFTFWFKKQTDAALMKLMHG